MWFLAENACFGCLGDTWEKSIQKYGKPKDRTPTGLLVYIPKPSARVEWEFEGFSIIQAWLPPEGANGRCDFFYISKHTSPGGLTSEQIQALLEKNSENLQWKRNCPAGITDTFLGDITARMPTKWIRSDGATAETNGGFCVFKSARLAKAESAKETAKKIEQERIPNF
jgi:hypothetical protein